jgi:hypothetical protein
LVLRCIKIPASTTSEGALKKIIKSYRNFKKEYYLVTSTLFMLVVLRVKEKNPAVSTEGFFIIST